MNENLANAPIVLELIRLVTGHGELFQVDVSTRHSSASNPHDTFLANRHWLLIVIEDVACRVGKRPSNCERNSWGVSMSRVQNGNLCRTTDVVEVCLCGPFIGKSSDN
jgi:hypothetical protein